MLCRFLRSLIVLGCVCQGTVPLLADEIPADQLEFFEKKIRPVLVKSCYPCHSQQAEAEDELKGGLFLDTRKGLMRGGESGVVVVPGMPEDSLLYQSLNYESYEMPPIGKLPESVIADFRQWIQWGLPDPRVGDVADAREINIEQGRQFWSYQPLKYTLPAFSPDELSEGVIDQFILAKLATAKMKQGPLANRRVLIRRLYFDLLGLPPSVQAQQRFINDSSPDAYRRLVDELLASPRFGERWGRHWLDVVRYAESITLRGFLLPEAWRYRDYVVDSFNRDRSFAEFARQQIAGDLLPASTIEERQRQVIATTFLALGNSNLEDQDKGKLRMDVVDEQLETIGRGFMGQTIGCARCHDHKFDPIPTRDYYALAGILRNTKTLTHANVSRWIELPLPQSQAEEAVLASYNKKLGEIQKQIDALQSKMTATGPVAVANLSGIVVDDEQAKLTGQWTRSTSSKTYVGKGYQHDMDQNKGTKTALFETPLPLNGKYEVRFSYTPGTNRTASLPVVVTHAGGKTTMTINQTKSPPLLGRFISLGQYEFSDASPAQVTVSTLNTTAHVIIDAVQFLPVEEEPLETLADMPEKDARAKEQLAKLQSQLKVLKADAPAPRPLYMSVQEEEEIGDTQIHVRGDVHNLGASVARGVMQVLPLAEPLVFSDKESGRRQLADWIADPTNPLTARVVANRIWHWLMGAGIVRSVDNFGATGERPSHPQLLDYLAMRLQQGRWSIKSLIREIVLSRTYQLSSASEIESTKQDPENRLLSRMNRRRLDAECILDAMLLVSGSLDQQLGGSEINAGTANDYNYVHGSRRRAVYWPVLRNSIAEVLSVYDFANPSMVVGSRDISASAPQALFMMNSERVMNLANQAAQDLLRIPDLDDRQRIQRVIIMILGRDATEQEIKITTEYLVNNDTHRLTETERWTNVIQALFASLDFRYVY
ncbi:MAG: DUF1553 domain-containing protein [Planctomycetota bacterium]|nr:DUF1553 domain-containing protein [Planctomycetota bacterium]